MSRNKPLRYVLALLLALAPTVVHTEETPISPNLLPHAENVAEAANYETVEVALGTYERIASGGGSPYYPYSYNLRFETPNAKFKEFLVRRNDTVKAGDVLATFTLEADEISLANQTLLLARAQEALQERQETDQAQLEEMHLRYLRESDRAERDMLKLQIAYREVSLQKYVYEQSCRIEQIQEEITQLREKSERNVLVAPVDGVVTSVAYLREGDRVSTGEVLVTLYREEGMLLRVDNSSNQFRYGMRVSVEIGPGKNRTALKGTVVAADTLLPEARRTHHAFIRLDPCELPQKLLNPTVKAPSEYAEHIIVVPRRAVTLDGGKYYVTKLVDGTLKKRYVQYLTNNPTTTWLALGIEPGETIVIE